MGKPDSPVSSVSRKTDGSPGKGRKSTSGKSEKKRTQLSEKKKKKKKSKKQGMSDPQTDDDQTLVKESKRKTKKEKTKKTKKKEKEKKKRSKDKQKDKDKKKKKAKKAKILTSSSDDSDQTNSETENGPGDRIRIDREFAKQYEEEQTRLALSRKQNRQQQKLQRSSLFEQLVKEVGGKDRNAEDSDAEEEEEEDSDAGALDNHLDAQINDLLWRLKRKDPSIYDPNAEFFSEPAAAEESSDPEEEKRLPVISVREGIAKQLLEGGIVDSDDEEEAARRRAAPARIRERIRTQLVEEIKEQLGDDSEASDSEMFVKITDGRKKSAAEREEPSAEQLKREDQEYQRWLQQEDRKSKRLRKRQAEDSDDDDDSDDDGETKDEFGLPKTSSERSQEALRRYFQDSAQKQADMDFLRRYIFHEWWRGEPKTRRQQKALEKQQRRQQSGAEQGKADGGDDGDGDDGREADIPSATEILGEERRRDLQRHLPSGVFLGHAEDFSSGSEDEADDERGTGEAGKKKKREVDDGVVDWDSEDEEAHLDEVDVFERRHNFRFEEEGAGEHISHARVQEDSVRQTVSRRKKAREERRKRLEEERRLKAEELKRLKGLKRREIETKLSEIARIAGLPVDFLRRRRQDDDDDDSSDNSSDVEMGGMDDDNDDETKEKKDDDSHEVDLGDFDEDEIRRAKILAENLDLEADFDPDKHDELMAKIFDDDFYAAEDGEKDRPEVISELIRSELDEEGDDKAGRKKKKEQKDSSSSSNRPTTKEERRAAKAAEDAALEQELDELLLAGRNNKNPASRPGQYMRQYRDKLKRILKNQRKRLKQHAETASGPEAQAQQSELEQSVKELSANLEQLEELDYEDMLGGEIPVRFKYREVKPSSYGMSVEEILELPDRELNARVSLKQLSAYREDGDSDFNWWERRNNSLHARRIRQQKLGQQPRRHGQQQPSSSSSASTASSSSFRPRVLGKRSWRETEAEEGEDGSRMGGHGSAEDASAEEQVRKKRKKAGKRGTRGGKKKKRKQTSREA